MAHDRPEVWRETDRFLLAGLRGLAVAAIIVLATSHLSALVFDGSWPRYRLADSAGILGRFLDGPELMDDHVHG